MALIKWYIATYRFVCSIDIFTILFQRRNFALGVNVDPGLPIAVLLNDLHIKKLCCDAKIESD